MPLPRQALLLLHSSHCLLRPLLLSSSNRKRALQTPPWPNRKASSFVSLSVLLLSNFVCKLICFSAKPLPSFQPPISKIHLLHTILCSASSRCTVILLRLLLCCYPVTDYSRQANLFFQLKHTPPNKSVRERVGSWAHTLTKQHQHNREGVGKP